MAWIDDIFRFVAHGRKPDGSLDECRLDGDGNLRVAMAAAESSAAVDWDDSPGFVSNRVVKATAGTLLHLAGYSETNGYLLVFDANKLPADGGKPVLAPVLLWAGWSITLPLPTRGRAFKSGIVWAVSSTPDTLTHDPTGRAFVNAQRS